MYFEHEHREAEHEHEHDEEPEPSDADEGLDRPFLTCVESTARVRRSPPFWNGVPYRARAQ